MLPLVTLALLMSDAPQVTPALPSDGHGGYPVLKLVAQAEGSDDVSVVWLYGGFWNELVQKAGPVPEPRSLCADCVKPPQGLRVAIASPGSEASTKYILYRLEQQAFFTGNDQAASKFVHEAKFHPDRVQVLGWSYGSP